MKIENTKAVECGTIKVLVHAPAKTGKTRLCGTTGGKTIILSAEAGLLSLRGQDIDFKSITSLPDLYEAYEYLKTDRVYDWVCIDSISEIAEVVLSSEKGKTNDPRKAYGEMQDVMTRLIRAYRDLPKNVYMSAKQERVKDDVSGAMYFGPSAPGQKISQQLPYFFDEVFALHVWKDEDGEIKRALQTGRDNQYEAGDRSGALEFIEPADLSVIYNKIMNKTNTKGE